jgi:mono/diheme cytochrome c family protein
MKSMMFCLILALSGLTFQAHAADIDAAGLYHDYCSVCHGDKGDGKSHAMQGLVPPPRDFTSPQSSIELNFGRIVHAIREGVPGTAMTAWKSRLSAEQIEAISRHIQQKFLRPATVETATEGSRIYADFCSVCHGDTGKGSIWATSGLNPRPLDFTSTEALATLDRLRMINAVSYGRSETAMTGWKNRLTDTQIEVVVDYVINSFMSGSNAEKKLLTELTPASVDTRANMDLPMPFNLLGDYNKGAALYMNNCSTCHGVTGDGRGPRAYFINPKPRNFLHTSSRAMLNRPALYESVAKGKLRTEMPGWETVLDPQQMADVSEFVYQQFIREK